MVNAANLRVYDALAEATADGWPATVREVMRMVGLASPSTAHRHLVILEEAGLAERHPRSAAGGWRVKPR